MEKITILISTYNGENYLIEQINSILNQEGVEVSIFVRDDSSTDSTQDILNELQKKGVLNWYEGENLGPAKSFIDLVHQAPDSDFYAFCDQDDVWYEKKLSNATNEIKKYNMNEITLYTSTYDVVDEDLNFIKKRDMKFNEGLTLPYAIVGKAPSGCTMVFNRKLKEKISEYFPENIRMHDFWTLMIVEAFHGNIITDDTSQLMYRQHMNNTVGFNKGVIIKFKRLFKSAIYGNNERKKQAKELYKGYKANLPSDSLKTLEYVVNYQNSLSNKVNLLFTKEFYTSSFKRNVLFVISVLLGLF
jgi:rhamnosyltransferase